MNTLLMLRALIPFTLAAALALQSTRGPSIAKTLTGVAIMQLRDRGHFSLDDPAVKYVPELRQVHNPYGDISQVTIRHLMTHSAGFRAGTRPWGGDQPWHPFEPTRWEQVVAMMPYTEILFPPGMKYSYSNP